jgi:hypothetical protein
MFFDANRDGKTLSGKSYPHPALVFSIDGHRDLAVRALLANGRPGRNSQIAIAPYWNTSADGAYASAQCQPRKALVSTLLPPG